MYNLIYKFVLFNFSIIERYYKKILLQVFSVNFFDVFRQKN